MQADNIPTFSHWVLAFLLLAGIGWIWPYDATDAPERLLNDERWALGWLTVVIILGAAVGFIFQSRWTVLLLPIALYTGGLISWFQFEWGWREPVWEDLARYSAAALGLLMGTGGMAAGIACRVVAVEPDAIQDARGQIRLSAPTAGLLGLLALTANVLLPFPYLGALFGFAAILAAIALWQETQPTVREQLLAVPGMMIGGAIIVIQLYSLWGLVRGLL